jgi:hypothetical protein
MKIFLGKPEVRLQMPNIKSSGMAVGMCAKM